MIVTADEIKQRADKIVEVACGYTTIRVLEGKTTYPNILIRGEVDEAVDLAIKELSSKGVNYDRIGDWMILNTPPRT